MLAAVSLGTLLECFHNLFSRCLKTIYPRLPGIHFHSLELQTHSCKFQSITNVHALHQPKKKGRTHASAWELVFVKSNAHFPVVTLQDSLHSVPLNTLYLASQASPACLSCPGAPEASLSPTCLMLVSPGTILGH